MKSPIKYYGSKGSFQNEILSRLESGNFFTSISDDVSEKEKLKIIIEKLKNQYQILKTRYFGLKRAILIKQLL